MCPTLLSIHLLPKDRAVVPPHHRLQWMKTALIWSNCNTIWTMLASTSLVPIKRARRKMTRTKMRKPPMKA